MKQVHIPCPKCPSSDAYCTYADGSGFCFSCQTYTPPDGATFQNGYTYQFVPLRGINVETYRKYNVRTKVSEDGTPVAVRFPYTETAAKMRSLIKKKDIWVDGDYKDQNLFGKDLFTAGGNEIILTEGEFDALAAWQMLGIPAVSIKSSSEAQRNCRLEYEWLNSFKKIYLAFDNDDVGQKATSAVAPIFSFDKIFLLKMEKYNDPNEYLERKAVSEFREIFKHARKFLLDGVVSSYADVEDILKEGPREIICSYPFKGLDGALDGMGGGEVVLFSGLEGIGKTEVLRAFEYHVLKETDHNIGIIHLEETKKKSVHGLVGYELSIPLKDDTGVTHAEKMDAYRNLTRRDDRVYIYSHYGSDDPNDVLNIVRFLVAVCGCRVVFFDHINIAVSGLQVEDERKTIDYITTQLAMLCEQFEFTLVMISHLNDIGLTRGSRNTSNVAHVHVAMSRDTEHPQQSIRNTIELMVRKNRPTGTTGPVPPIIYDEVHGKLRDVQPEIDDFHPEAIGE